MNLLTPERKAELTQFGTAVMELMNKFKLAPVEAASGLMAYVDRACAAGGVNPIEFHTWIQEGMNGDLPFKFEPAFLLPFPWGPLDEPKMVARLSGLAHRVAQLNEPVRGKLVEILLRQDAWCKENGGGPMEFMDWFEKVPLYSAENVEGMNL